jgi:hypothetical protein
MDGAVPGVSGSSEAVLAFKPDVVDSKREHPRVNQRLICAAHSFIFPGGSAWGNETASRAETHAAPASNPRGVSRKVAKSVRTASRSAAKL